MERLNKRLCHGIVLGLLAALLIAAGGCSAKDGAVPAKGGGCSLVSVRIFG